MKRPIKRVILGKGYPFFHYDVKSGFGAVSLQKEKGRIGAIDQELKIGPLSDLVKIRLVAEIL